MPFPRWRDMRLACFVAEKIGGAALRYAASATTPRRAFRASEESSGCSQDNSHSLPPRCLPEQQSTKHRRATRPLRSRRRSTPDRVEIRLQAWRCHAGTTGPRRVSPRKAWLTHLSRGRWGSYLSASTRWLLERVTMMSSEQPVRPGSSPVPVFYLSAVISRGPEKR